MKIIFPRDEKRFSLLLVTNGLVAEYFPPKYTHCCGMQGGIFSAPTDMRLHSTKLHQNLFG